MMQAVHDPGSQLDGFLPEAGAHLCRAISGYVRTLCQRRVAIAGAMVLRPAAAKPSRHRCSPLGAASVARPAWAFATRPPADLRSQDANRDWRSMRRIQRLQGPRRGSAASKTLVFLTNTVYASSDSTTIALCRGLQKPRAVVGTLPTVDATLLIFGASIRVLPPRRTRCTTHDLDMLFGLSPRAIYVVDGYASTFTPALHYVLQTPDGLLRQCPVEHRHSTKTDRSTSASFATRPSP